MIHKNKLEEWGFLHTHTFALDGITSIPVCAALAETRAVNSVYLWLSQLSSDEFEVMYVGKAGKGIKKRLKEHQNGFKRSPTGMKSANLIRQLLAQKKTLSIYTREYVEIQLFDFTINAYSAEEDALIQGLSPKWNGRK